LTPARYDFTLITNTTNDMEFVFEDFNLEGLKPILIIREYNNNNAKIIIDLTPFLIKTDNFTIKVLLPPNAIETEREYGYYTLYLKDQNENVYAVLNGRVFFRRYA
jgi:hypothetical protein